MNKMSFIVNKTFQVLKYREVSDLGTTLVQTYTVSQVDFGFKNVIDAV
jgi:hypothetical protein